MAIISTCTIDDCGKRQVARGWCPAHYRKWSKFGDPLHGRSNGGTLKFLHNVAIPHRGNECLTWPYSCGKHGYAQIKIDSKQYLVHRLVCEAVHGPAPAPEHEATHSCNRGKFGCVAPDHLSWKTHQGNMDDQLIHGTRIRGARQGLAKLTEADVRKIRPMLGSKSQSAIGKMFGVSGGAISQIKSGRAWGWVQ